MKVKDVHSESLFNNKIMSKVSVLGFGKGGA
jgi:hypothetical protein